MDELTETPVENREEALFVDPIACEQLSEAARWAKFLAIMGFIACGIMVVAGMLMAIAYFFMNHVPARYGYSGRAINTAGRSGFTGVVYLGGAVLYLFRCLYLYRFAVKMRSGLHERSQDELNESFTNLKKMFRYNGILTIVLVLLYVVILFAVMIAALNR